MALDPLEWIVIAVVVLVIFLWGPQKIPEIARSIGRARKEFNTASKELQQMTNELKNPASFLEDTTNEPAATPPAPKTESRTPEQILIDSARKLGLSTEGKTKEQISQEILAKSEGAA